MSPVALKSERAYRTPAYDLPFRAGLVIAAALVVLCFLSALTAPQAYDPETMTMLIGP